MTALADVCGMAPGGSWAAAPWAASSMGSTSSLMAPGFGEELRKMASGGLLKTSVSIEQSTRPSKMKAPETGRDRHFGEVIGVESGAEKGPLGFTGLVRWYSKHGESTVDS